MFGAGGDNNNNSNNSNNRGQQQRQRILFPPPLLLLRGDDGDDPNQPLLPPPPPPPPPPHLILGGGGGNNGIGALLGGGGGGTIHRDGVGIITIRRSGRRSQHEDNQPNNMGRPTPTPTTGGPDEFLRSIQTVFQDKNIVDMVVKTVIVVPNTNNANRTITDNDDDDDDDDDTEDGNSIMSLASILQQGSSSSSSSSNTDRIMDEWKSLVQERHWKSICFEQCQEDVDTPRMRGNLNLNLDNEHGLQQQEQQPQQQEPQLGNSDEEELLLWRRLIEPCTEHATRLEFSGGISLLPARVLSTVTTTTTTRARTAAGMMRAVASASGRNSNKLRTISLVDMNISNTDVVRLLGTAIRGNSESVSSLTEVSLTKTTLPTPGSWSVLLGPSEEGNNNNDGDDDNQRLQSQPSLRALYLSDCYLTSTDVEDIITAINGYHPFLKTLYMNGRQQRFTPNEVDEMILSQLLGTHVELQQIVLPATQRHDPKIQFLTELNQCGRRLLLQNQQNHQRRRRHQQRRRQVAAAPPAVPTGLWSLVLQRITRSRRLSSASQANVLYYFVRELNGLESGEPTIGGSDGNTNVNSTVALNTTNNGNDATAAAAAAAATRISNARLVLMGASRAVSGSFMSTYTASATATGSDEQAWMDTTDTSNSYRSSPIDNSEDGDETEEAEDSGPLMMDETNG
jgi:hypothetical protein